MNYQAAERVGGYERTRTMDGRTATRGPAAGALRRPVTPARIARTVTRWVVGMLFFGLGEVIVWLWLNGGGMARPFCCATPMADSPWFRAERSLTPAAD